jgi:hypothetical protein
VFDNRRLRGGTLSIWRNGNAGRTVRHADVLCYSNLAKGGIPGGNEMTTPGIQDPSDMLEALERIYNAAQTDPAAADYLHQLAESCPPVPAPDAKPVEVKKP